MCGANTDKERGAAAAHTKTKKGRVVLKESYKPLLTPWKIGKVEIKNRIVLTSMGGTDLFGWMEVNHFDKDGARFILEVAKNNAGLVLPGCQPVYNPMYGQWLHKNKKMYEDLAKWMPEVHKTGAKLFGLRPELHHLGDDGKALHEQGAARRLQAVHGSR